MASHPRAGADSGTGGAERTAPGAGSWTFLSNHAHVLLCLAADPHQTLPVIAEQVGITSRAVQFILTDLIEGGYVERTRVGRCNRYRINPDGHLRHPLEAHHRIADLIAALGPAATGTTSVSARDGARDSGPSPRRARRTGRPANGG
ncbi:MAG TPA: winged helix-turn-helix domain-containing protein [Pseudonocardiaceae bacterium]|nr:winged helix-turn-helix domain-containing protein [Pseudonocardiaceae bacterium]